MQYYSLNHTSPAVDFKEATIKGQAPDKGLYFPQTIPALPERFLKEINQYSKEEIALQVIRPYVGDTIPGKELEQIVAETIDFDFPLIKISDDIFSLELFHGPTLAFKDVGARFMSRCLGYFVKNNSAKVTVLVATSGDTGSAVANGFYDTDGVEVIILYPAGKVSNIQELQLITPGKNITAIKIDGSFDDCQQLVKQAFADKELNSKLFLTSANSINVARWLPQQFYYFFAYRQWPVKDRPPVICVPSGNFGNICAGLLAHLSGLPVKHFVAACNANDTVPAYLESGQYKTKQSVSTISNAMDVAAPSNFVRVLELFDNIFSSLKNKLSSYSITDDETRQAVKNVFTNHQYLLDPHGAVGYCALKKYLEDHPGEKGIFLETAHPVKFYDVVEAVTGEKIKVPAAMRELSKKEAHALLMKADYNDFKGYLKSRR